MPTETTSSSIALRWCTGYCKVGKAILSKLLKNFSRSPKFIVKSIAMPDRMKTVQFITNRQIYEKVICGAIPSASFFVWLATADLKDLYVEKRRKKMVPFLEIIADLLSKGVKVRLIHAKQPTSRPFARISTATPNW